MESRVGPEACLGLERICRLGPAPSQPSVVQDRSDRRGGEISTRTGDFKAGVAGEVSR